MKFIETLKHTISVTFQYDVLYLDIHDDTERQERSISTFMNKDQLKELISSLSELHDQMPDNDL